MKFTRNKSKLHTKEKSAGEMIHLREREANFAALAGKFLSLLGKTPNIQKARPYSPMLKQCPLLNPASSIDADVTPPPSRLGAQ